MKPKTQKQIWNEIAPEWHEFKKKPSIFTTEFLQKQKGKVLDLGSGSGRNLIPLKNAKMYLVDFSEKMIGLAKKKAEILKGEQIRKKEKLDFSASLLGRRGRASDFAREPHNRDERGRELGTGGSSALPNKVGIPEKSTSELPHFTIAPMSKLPFKNNFFDAAICISALHCIENSKEREKTIRELHRILKPRAHALIAVWNKNSKRFQNSKTKEKLIGWRNKGKRYYYLYDENEIHNLFEKNNFKITKSQNSPLMIRFVAQKI